MKVTNSTIQFTHHRRKYEGQVSMFQPEEKLLVRVYVPIDAHKEEVFIFYKAKPGELFWHDHNNDFKQAMAKTIAGKLLES